jgi:hypothetical protein
MPQYKLKVFLALAKLHDLNAAIVYAPPESNGTISAVKTSVSELERDFIV